MPSADWTAVLDDLESRLTAAEAGDLLRLGGWTLPSAGPMPVEHATRALSVLDRQHALLQALAAQRDAVHAALAGLRRPVLRAVEPAPRYVDRSA